MGVGRRAGCRALDLPPHPHTPTHTCPSPPPLLQRLDPEEQHSLVRLYDLAKKAVGKAKEAKKEARAAAALARKEAAAALRKQASAAAAVARKAATALRKAAEAAEKKALKALKARK